MTLLPIDEVLPEILRNVKEHSAVVIKAAPGAGKTTRVPPALLKAGLAERGDVVVLEPRRLATRMAARAVAREFGDPVGKTVGYQVRFDDRTGPDTRIRFVTEGILARRLISDPELRGTAVVILDEFHERHLVTDVALARLRHLQQTVRPDLKLVVMSATLDTEALGTFLGNAPVVNSEGRQFPVTVEYQKRHSAEPVERQVADALERCLETIPAGDVLVFLPGAAEIRKCRSACQSLVLSRDLLSLVLHGDLSPEEQDAVVRPANRRKVIFSTNLAESSVTIDGVAVVIDAGTARVAQVSPWSGLPSLTISRISQASAIQRAGRAGRTAPGTCFRLYSEADFSMRPAFDTAEIHRADLSEVVLELRAGGIAELEWFESPPVAALSAAENLLTRLGALDAAGKVTATGVAMLKYPLHPRLARLVVEATSRGAGDLGILAAALLSERDIRNRSFGDGKTTGHDDSDVLTLCDDFGKAEAVGFQPQAVRELGLDAAAVQSVERVRRQLSSGRAGKRNSGGETASDAVMKAILAAFPDRVARVRRPATGRNLEVSLPGGGTAQLSPSSVIRQEGPICAVDAELRGTAQAVVRLASRIEPDWILELFFDDIEEFDIHEWSAASERVVRRRGWSFNGIVFEEKQVQELDVARAGEVLAAEIGRRGWRAFADDGSVTRLMNRIGFLARHFSEAGIPEMTDERILEAIGRLCRGSVRVGEVRAALRGGLESEILAGLSNEHRRLLDRAAPEFLTLGNRRRARIAYEADQPPYVASRLQDFFGMTETPRIAEGRAQLVLHLLAPNNRPVQVTTDLKGFWERVYRELRPQLSRRYPRHAFPENPLAPVSGK